MFLIPERCVLFLFLAVFLSMSAEASDMKTINLPEPVFEGNFSVERAISERRSVRAYSSKDLTVEAISRLLWAAQGVTGSNGLRAAPSAGALYPLEIYLAKRDGLYRYIPEGHKLKKISDKNIKNDLALASRGQTFVEKAPIDIIICAVYERVTARYGKRGIRYTDIEVGHASQNVHLEAVSMGLSSVPVGAFDDDAVAKVLGLPVNEKPIYIIPVGYKEQ